MNSNPSNLNPTPTHLPVPDPSHEVIDLQQWQLEIDNFIDETSNELNELARMLEGGPLSQFAAESTPLENRKSTSQNARQNPSRKPTSSNRPEKADPTDSTDRFASLRKKLASRIEQTRDAE